MGFSINDILPLESATVDSLASIVYRIPSYRIFAFETRLIFEPKYGESVVPVADVGFFTDELLFKLILIVSSTMKDEK